MQLPSRSEPTQVRGIGLLLAAAVLLGTTGCAPGAPQQGPGGEQGAAAVSTGAPAAPMTAGSALQALTTLAVKGRAPETGYDRAQFGQAWADTDHNGCDTRNDVLRRDITGAELKAGTRGCVVAAGILEDPYSGTPITFRRGERTSSAVQIDHVVALSDAWQTGAQQLTPDQRTALANDPLNLLAVDGPLNQQKSDGDAATWLPPRSGYRCAYVARQVAVKTTYGLWVTPAEHDAIATVLDGCPGQALPDISSVATPPTGSTGGAEAVSTPASAGVPAG